MRPHLPFAEPHTACEIESGFSAVLSDGRRAFPDFLCQFCGLPTTYAVVLATGKKIMCLFRLLILRGFVFCHLLGYWVRDVLQKGRTSWVHESDEPDRKLYGGGRKGVKRCVLI